MAVLVVVVPWCVCVCGAGNNIQAQGVQLLAQVLPQLPNLTELDLQRETSHPSTFISTVCLCVKEEEERKRGKRGEGREESQKCTIIVCHVAVVREILPAFLSVFDF